MCNLWWSAGGTKSVVHRDSEENLNCVFAGSKRFAFWSPAHAETITDASLCGWADVEGKPELGYGEFAAALDVDRVDLERLPGWGRPRGGALLRRHLACTSQGIPPCAGGDLDQITELGVDGRALSAQSSPRDTLSCLKCTCSQRESTQ